MAPKAWSVDVEEVLGYEATGSTRRFGDEEISFDVGKA